jgi:hypothetical protein
VHPPLRQPGRGGADDSDPHRLVLAGEHAEGAVSAIEPELDAGADATNIAVASGVIVNQVEQLPVALQIPRSSGRNLRPPEP